MRHREQRETIDSTIPFLYPLSVDEKISLSRKKYINFNKKKFKIIIVKLK